MTCGIYCITNKINGKQYVGQAIDIESRFRQHIEADSNSKIHDAIEKYGVANFEFEIIIRCTKGELDEQEIKFIRLLDTYNNGYNQTIGGQGHVFNPHKGELFPKLKEQLDKKDEMIDYLKERHSQKLEEKDMIISDLRNQLNDKKKEMLDLSKRLTFKNKRLIEENRQLKIYNESLDEKNIRQMSKMPTNENNIFLKLLSENEG